MHEQLLDEIPHIPVLIDKLSVDQASYPVAPEVLNLNDTLAGDLGQGKWQNVEVQYVLNGQQITQVEVTVLRRHLYRVALVVVLVHLNIGGIDIPANLTGTSDTLCYRLVDLLHPLIVVEPVLPVAQSTIILLLHVHVGVVALLINEEAELLEVILSAEDQNGAVAHGAKWKRLGVRQLHEAADDVVIFIDEVTLGVKQVEIIVILGLAGELQDHLDVL